MPLKLRTTEQSEHISTMNPAQLAKSGPALKAAQRLIVAADFKPTGGNGRKWVWEQVIGLATKLKGTGIVFKVNSALRACGYDLIDAIHQLGLEAFADLKLIDVDKTLETDGALLKEAQPEMLTAMCSSGIRPLKALKSELPDLTEALGVTVLTSHKEEDCQAMFTCSIRDAVLRFAGVARDSEFNGLISAATDLEALTPDFGTLLTFNTPAIRPHWFTMQKEDHQNQDRVMTPKGAIRAGARRIVVGSPILEDADPLSAVQRTITEIEQGIEELHSSLNA